MANIMLRPDLKTAGGEINDIVYKNRFVGTLSLVYREGNRMSGSIQLDQSSLAKKDKQHVVEFVHDYVQQLIDALQVEECDVIVTYGTYDHIIATDANVGVIEQFIDAEDDGLDVDNLGYEYGEEPRFEDFDMYDRDTLDNQAQTAYYELVVVGESRNRVEYHVYDRDKNWVSEAFVKIYGPDVVGEVNWTFEPTDEEIEHVTDLIVSDFDENEVDTFVLDMIFDQEIVETIELTHEDLIDDAGLSVEGVSGSDDYSIILIRDDGDTLTYEIYKQTHGGLPIGSATVDISRKQLTGFIDFRNEDSTDDRDLIAMLLMQELDKEKDYDSINLTMLYQNNPIDELIFENERVH